MLPQENIKPVGLLLGQWIGIERKPAKKLTFASPKLRPAR
jgi:hypothetical protein